MQSAELKEWRRKLGLTQEAAAKVFGVTRVTEQNWEGGATPVPAWADDRRENYEASLRRRPEYGPVVLQYWLSPRGPGHPPEPNREPVRREWFSNNQQALDWATEKEAQASFFRGMIFSEDDEHLIFGSASLTNEIDRRKRVVRQRRTPEEIDAMRRAIREIQDEIAAIPDRDPNFTDKDLYDEDGLPK